MSGPRARARAAARPPALLPRLKASTCRTVLASRRGLAYGTVLALGTLWACASPNPPAPAVPSESSSRGASSAESSPAPPSPAQGIESRAAGFAGWGVPVLWWSDELVPIEAQGSGWGTPRVWVTQQTAEALLSEQDATELNAAELDLPETAEETEEKP